MDTTELYVEYIIIGIETLCWVCLLCFFVIGNEFVNIFKYCISNIVPSIIMLGICYVLGLVTDGIADKILDKRKMDIKDHYPIKAKTSLVVWEKYNQTAYAKFTLSKIRILRATTINSIIINISAVCVILKYDYNKGLMYLIFFLLVAIFIISNFTHKRLLNDYYKRTQALDKSEEKMSKIFIA